MSEIIFLTLMVIILVHKSRSLFPVLYRKFEHSWKYFIQIEQELDLSFLHYDFIEYLQLELIEQKRCNERRAQELMVEYEQLTSLVKCLEDGGSGNGGGSGASDGLLDDVNNNNQQYGHQSEGRDPGGRCDNNTFVAMSMGNGGFGAVGGNGLQHQLGLANTLDDDAQSGAHNLATNLSVVS